MRSIRQWKRATEGFSDLSILIIDKNTLLPVRFIFLNITGENCRHKEPTMQNQQIEYMLEPGDILFTVIPNFLYRRVANATGSLTSHVGVAFFDRYAGWQIAESGVPTVRYSPIADFIARSDKDSLIVRRLRDGLSTTDAKALRNECDARMGILYHLGFNYESPRQFCSKFVYDTYLAALGVEIGTLESFRTLLDKQPETSLFFWRLWFLGRIPWTRLTITPASQLLSDKLTTVWQTSRIMPSKAVE